MNVARCFALLLGASLISGGVFAHKVYTRDQIKIIRSAAVIARARIIRVRKDVERCSADTSLRLRPLRFIKGSLPSGKDLDFSWTVFFPRKARWFWQKDCPRVHYFVPPLARNLERGREVIVTIGVAPKKDASRKSAPTVTGTFDPNRENSIRELLKSRP